MSNDDLSAADRGCGFSAGLGALVAQLRSAASAGYDDWRVQDPKDGSYCIAYSWPESMSPEREARAWLADQKARFPNSRQAGYVVECVRVVPTKDRLLAAAADELERLAAGPWIGKCQACGHEHEAPNGRSERLAESESVRVRG